MEIKLDVTLDTNPPPYLDVDEQNGSNHIPKNASAYTIKWKLASDASSGSFNSLSDPQPGFAWIQTPDQGIFGAPVVSSNGKEITISDLNNSAASTGQWIYQLSATIGNVVYQSNATSITGTTTNPTIKNN